MSPSETEDWVLLDEEEQVAAAANNSALASHRPAPAPRTVLFAQHASALDMCETLQALQLVGLAIKVRAAPLVRVKAKFTVKNAV